ncbi:hypothetical protein ACIA8G_20940 [Lentzea sp. NPDC051213]|uniref:hypothetical protein n=1 Tax=Lentzea sp. NPDC051213 TaxID=3364126 RepID=UPI00379BC263
MSGFDHERCQSHWPTSTGTHPVRLDGRESIDVVTFGSDGGGTLFALGLPDGAPGYLLPPSGVDRSGDYVVHDRLDPIRCFS